MKVQSQAESRFKTTESHTSQNSRAFPKQQKSQALNPPEANLGILGQLDIVLGKTYGDFGEKPEVLSKSIDPKLSLSD